MRLPAGRREVAQAPISAGKLDRHPRPSAAYPRSTLIQNEWDRDQDRVE